MTYSKYPGEIDDDVTLPITVDLVTEVKAEVVNRLRDSIIATETTLGTNPNSSYATVADRLVAIEAAGGGISGSGTDNHLVRWDGTGAVQDSGWVLNDSDEVRTPDGAAGVSTNNISIGSGSGGDSATGPGGYSGYSEMVSGAGGNSTSGTDNGGDAGSIYVWVRDAGSATGAGNIGGSGGSVAIYAGDGGDGVSNADGGYPGTVWIQGGKSGDLPGVGIGGGQIGGRIDIRGGTAGKYTILAGGPASIQGGQGSWNPIGDGGKGGNTNIIGGDGGTTPTKSDGGDVSVQGGNAGGTGTDGVINVGLVNTSAINIGATGIPTTINGELYIDDGGSGTAAFLDMVDGASAAVSAAGHVRLRSNAGALEASQNGGAWAPVGGGPWTDTGTVVYVTTTTRNVAIGASSMVGSEKLRVNGSTYLSGNINFNGATTRYIEILAPTTLNTAGSELWVRAGGASAGSQSGGRMYTIGGTGALNASGTGGAGGEWQGYAGAGGQSTSGTGGIGGATYLTGGTGGIGTVSRGDGGAVGIAGGFGGANGGTVSVDGGRAQNIAGTDGAINIGTTRASAINIGASGDGTLVTVYTSLLIDSTTASENFFDLDDGTGAAVSAAGHIRLRSNAGTFEVSENGGAWAAPGGGGGITGSGTDNNIMRWNGTDAAQDSSWALGDTGALTVAYNASARTNSVAQAPDHTANSAWYWRAGKGGNANTANAGGGGTFALYAGFGGDGTATYDAGFGGSMYIYAGNAGANNGGGGNYGGWLTMEAGDGSGTGLGGRVLFYAGNGGTDGGDAGYMDIRSGFGGAGTATNEGGGEGGYIQIQANSGGSAYSWSATGTGGAGGDLLMYAGNGGLGSIGGIGGEGGQVVLHAGAGGASGTQLNSGDAGNGGAWSGKAGNGGSAYNDGKNAGDGGWWEGFAGDGGRGNDTYTPGIGGYWKGGAGKSGQANDANAPAGGYTELFGGEGGGASNTHAAGAGGTVTVYGGVGGTGTSFVAAGAGGAATIRGGDGGVNGGFGGAVGGDAAVTGGAGTGTANDGDVYVGSTQTNAVHIAGSGVLLGFFAATAVAQPSTTGTTAGFTAGTGTSVNDDSTFTGNTGASAYTIGDIVKALKDLGLLAA